MSATSRSSTGHGPGSAEDGRQPVQTTTCQMTVARTTAPSWGQTPDHARANDLRTGRDVTGGASVSWMSGASSTAIRHLLLEPVCDAAGDDGELRGIETARARQVDVDLVRHAPRPARE